MKFSRNLFLCLTKLLTLILKIMELEKLNLVELNAQEIEHTEGGCWDCTGFFRYWGHQIKDLVHGFTDAF